MAALAKKRAERVLVMLDEDELRTLDSWRFQYRMPSRSAAIRELLRKGLADLNVGDATPGQKSDSFGVIERPAATG